MAILDVLRFPDERLRTVATPVAEVNEEIKQLVDDMFETMYDENGVGLAASQVDQHVRLFVADTSEERDEPLTFINPEIIARDGMVINEEGCLSVPNCYAKVERSETVTVRALDKDGSGFEMDAEGLLAICIQHELDHLDGKLFVDYLSPLKRDRIKKKLEKESRLAAKG
ncbi:peptide deformylase [Psychrosphaera sp. B3R10]|uniref:Peptide deformylase n=1 Tax=Psychrosphaera algicola TaxID=3023714 RepID=A0ABT5FEE2_9GAMM|nr:MULTISPECIES: peptide deformylase [unclassified Psychrosphaera]MBU2883245.1 peptide deformylase [Psychrosphaera sp. I2R16]MBU2990661.1 peptide deformylase [Psychrosphaera sp. B3R10]MDC2889904.1 peptide deformylase [Psychrosphaera sp. G1-22]MDO6718865.1 peptide deformylase [Psychrosphaera sp. 1_MG-2023]